MAPDEFASTTQCVLHWARQTPDAIAVIENGVSYTYRDLAAGIAQYVNALRATGVQPGMLVGLEFNLRYLHLILIMACEIIDAPSVSVSPADIAAGDEILARCQFLCVRTLPDDASRDGGLLHLTQATIDRIAGLPMSAEDLSVLHTRPDDDQILRLVRTSGSSGRAKVMAMSHAATRRLTRRTMAEGGRRNYAWNFVNVYNFTLRSAQFESMIALRQGKTVVSSHFETLVADLERFAECRLTLVTGDAIRLAGLCPLPWREPRACLLNVKGGPLSPLVRQILLRDVVTDLLHSYATVETYRLALTDGTDEAVVCADVAMRIVDDAGRSLPIGETGLIEVQSPTMVDGYLWDDAATRAAFIDGWYRTSDIGFMPAPDRVVVLGRADDMLNAGGIKFAPHKLEDRIRAIDGVSDAVLVALGNPNGADELHIALELRPDAHVPLIRDRIGDIVGSYARQFFMHEVRTLPRTATGKARRGDVRRMIAEQ